MKNQIMCLTARLIPVQRTIAFCRHEQPVNHILFSLHSQRNLKTDVGEEPVFSKEERN